MAKAPEGLRKNHLNRGQGGSHGLGAQHELTRLPDPEDISGDGAPAVDEAILRNHLNRGGAATHGLAAQHNTTRLADADELPTDFVGE